MSHLQQIRCKQLRYVNQCIQLRMEEACTQSKQLTTILNKWDHCESYAKLITAMAKTTLLTPQITTGKGNLLLHCEWDNFNKILTNVHGSNVHVVCWHHSISLSVT